MFFVPEANADDKKISAKDDYIPCDVQPCVTLAGSEWSEKNLSGVAVGIAMGTKPAATDNQIKQVILGDLKYYKVEEFKFFYEQNDAPATVFTFHVRGGTEGPFLIGEIRSQIPIIAKRALNTNQLFRDN